MVISISTTWQSSAMLWHGCGIVCKLMQLCFKHQALYCKLLKVLLLLLK